MRKKTILLTAAAVLLSSLGSTLAQVSPEVAKALRKKALFTQVKPVDVVLDQDKEELKNRDAQGPAGPPIRLGDAVPLDGLEAFPGVRGLQEVLNLSLEVFPDGNRGSGIYYYYPASYFLNWDPDTGYYLALDYKYEQESGSNVLLDARLSPGAIDRDRQLLAELLKLHLKAHGSPHHAPNAVQLFELPARYEVEFDWAALGTVEATVAGIDDVSREIALTLSTDVPTREMLIKKLGDGLGLEGRVRILPEQVTAQSTALPPIQVSARLMLTDDAYANRPWQRFRGVDHSEFQNLHDFPVRLEYLCYLYRTSAGVKLRGYRLGNAVLQPSGVARIPNSRVHSQIDGDRVLRAWYAYSLVNDPAHRDQVVQRLTGGVADIPVKRVALDVLRAEDLFAQYHLHKIVVIVRSAQFDPQGRDVLQHEYELTLDDSHSQLDALYVPSDDGSPLYEYRIGLVTEAGEQFLEPSWRPPSVLGDITVGANQIEEVMAR